MKTEPTLIKAALLAGLLALEWLLVAHEFGSPRGLSERTVIRPGTNSDHIDRGPTRISPKLAQQGERSTPGVAPDQLDRGPMKEPPKLHVPSRNTHGSTPCHGADQHGGADAP